MQCSSEIQDWARDLFGVDLTRGDAPSADEECEVAFSRFLRELRHSGELDDAALALLSRTACPSGADLPGRIQHLASIRPHLLSRWSAGRS